MLAAGMVCLEKQAGSASWRCLLTSLRERRKFCLGGFFVRESYAELRIQIRRRRSRPRGVRLENVSLAGRKLNNSFFTSGLNLQRPGRAGAGDGLIAMIGHVNDDFFFIHQQFKMIGTGHANLAAVRRRIGIEIIVAVGLRIAGVERKHGGNRECGIFTKRRKFHF